MPESCGKAFAQIGAEGESRSWDKAGEFGVLPADVTVHKGETLFPAWMRRKHQELESHSTKAKAPEVKPLLPACGYCAFRQVQDMRAMQGSFL